MKFLIVGPGAMGCLFGARLKKAGFDVTIMDYIEERAEMINRQGIMVEGIMGEYTVKVPIAHNKISVQPDFVLICVKSTKTQEAASTIATMVHDKAAVVTLQNGIGNVAILEEIFGKDRVLGGVTAEGATVLGWGKIRHGS